MEENKEENKVQNEEEKIVHNTFLNENLSVLEDKKKDFEVNLGTLDEEKDIDYNYDDFIKQEEVIEEVAPSKKIKKKKEKKVRSRKPFDISILFLLLAFISLFGLFFDNTIRIIGLILCAIALFGSMLTMDKLHKYSEASFTITVILAVVYIFVYVITLTKVNTDVDSKKAEEFKQYAYDVTESIKKDVLDSKAIKCVASGKTELKIVLPEEENNLSAFGNEYNREMSYVLVTSEEVNGKCESTFYIYLTDGNYSLGTIVSPIKEDRILHTDVRKVVREDN